ncbi:alpha/beta hydrolase [Rubripirellula reticaptiva]|uniref:Carboxylesterase NlhH n=1 Tax=Rubripirellula reticaptiva TaxID=2528013 RepID=A0A5C6EH46_9BACT|nr:alpha/beta hydrolase [Rubripirellula reticaptiva]TWU47041.1 Carboxylesterase NlhH [Rubripirellula reticaptiva]
MLNLRFSLLLLLTLSVSHVFADDKITAYEDLEFAKVQTNVGEKTLKLDLYRPKNDEALPGIVLVHGGGWSGGTKESFRPLARELATDDYVVITIEYRLSGEAMFPSAVEDCKAAIRWLRAHAAEYKVDPKRIGAVGGSAGGHLTGMVATTVGKYDVGNHLDQSSELQAAVLLGAGVDQVKRSEESAKPIQNCVVFFGGTLNEKREIYAEASPITHVSAKTCPILFMDGEKDRPGMRYVDIRPKLDQFGIDNEFIMIPGAKHGQWNKQPFRELYRNEFHKFFDANLK